MVGEVDDRVLQAPGDQLALAGVGAGGVRDRLGQPDGERNVDAIDGMTDRRVADGAGVSLPANLVTRAELERLPDIVAERAGKQEVAVQAE